jgi:hypothetical protein
MYGEDGNFRKATQPTLLNASATLNAARGDRQSLASPRLCGKKHNPLAETLQISLLYQVHMVHYMPQHHIPQRAGCNFITGNFSRPCGLLFCYVVEQ